MFVLFLKHQYYFSIISSVKLRSISPVPVRSTVLSYFTSCNIQMFSSLDLNNLNQQIQHQLQHLANCSRLFINERKFSKIIVTCFFNISSSYFINVVNQFRCYFIIIIYVLFCSYSIASTSSFYRVNTPSWLYHRVTLYFAKTNV